MLISGIAPVPDNWPRQRAWGQDDAAQSRMRVNKTVLGKNCEMNLSRCGLTQQYVTQLYSTFDYGAEAITIKKSPNSGLVIAAQRVIARYM
jgi:hypothetical protein